MDHMNIDILLIVVWKPAKIINISHSRIMVGVVVITLIVPLQIYIPNLRINNVLLGDKVTGMEDLQQMQFMRTKNKPAKIILT